MKKICVCLLMGLLLTGCAARQTFETVEDWYYESAVSAGVIRVDIPEGAAAAAFGSDAGSIYLCDGYTLCLQTFPGGDLEATLQSVSGFSRDRLELIQTSRQGMQRYDFVWAAAGEGGDQLGRASVLDDGHHHYVLSVMAPAESAGEYEQIWQGIFASFSLDTGT